MTWKERWKEAPFDEKVTIIFAIIIGTALVGMVLWFLYLSIEDWYYG